MEAVVGVLIIVCCAEGDKTTTLGVLDFLFDETGVDESGRDNGAGGSFFFLNRFPKSFFGVSFSPGFGVVGEDGTSSTVGRSVVA